ncbi:MAG: insulinase family protein [Candidatus Marinimicrobia bacterium]|nr:insulinase family protein [Candidatus Neomarinimicrobiota bacterium]
MNQHKITTLKNGLRLITIPMPQVESLTVMVGVGAGSRHETKQVNGLFHFLEHMAFKGTKKRPSTLAIATEIDTVGGEFNAFTDKEETGYYLKLAAKHQALAFDLLADMLQNSLFKKEEIEREKNVLIEELNMFEDIPTRQVMEVFVNLIYGDNPMGWDTGGKKETIRQIKREDFLKYIHRLYFPQNMVLVVAGKVVEKEIQSLAKQYFFPIKGKGKKQTKKIKLDQKKSRIKLTFKKTEQAHFCLGVPGYEYSHPDRFVLGLLATILGEGMSSRLFTQIRERRGLAYYVDCSPDFYTDSGYLVARAGVRLKKIGEALQVTLAEFADLVETKVTPAELKKAKEFIKGRFILSLEDSKNVAGRYLNLALLEKKIRTPEEVMALIDQVTAEDIQRVAKDIFKSEKLNLAIIGPYRDEKRFQKKLKF